MTNGEYETGNDGNDFSFEPSERGKQRRQQRKRKEEELRRGKAGGKGENSPTLSITTSFIFTNIAGHFIFTVKILLSFFTKIIPIGRPYSPDSAHYIHTYR